MARKEYRSNLQGNIFLIVGLLLMSIFAGWRYHQARILSFNSEIVSEYKTSGVKPVYIKSYPVGVDIEIKDATINNGVWAIHPNSANYLISSAGIGDIGNTIIYGHNNNQILGPIRWIEVGAEIEIIGSDNKNYYYKVVKTDTVSPENLEYIKPKDTETLTVYTCVGFLDSQRFIVVAERQK